MPKEFFISDGHWGHLNIMTYCCRGYGTYAERKAYSSLRFKSTDEMDALMIERWNERVAPEDTVYYLGDIMMGDKNRILDIFPLLNGTVHLVFGNHDCVNHGFQEGILHPAILEAQRCGLLASIQRELYATIDGRNVWMAHIPYGHLNDRRAFKRPKVRPGFSLTKDVILSGHVHDKWYWNKQSSINVGADLNNFYPVTLAEALAKTNDEPRFDSTIVLPV